jgi:hypothetical protein
LAHASKRRQFWLAAFALHFLGLTVVSSWDLIDVVGSGRTLLPPIIAEAASSLATALKSLSPRGLTRPNPLRQIIVGYGHAAGIENPYSFFAPNVPESLKVVFELRFRDQSVSYKLPRVSSQTEGLRLSALIDQAAANPGPWREVVLQMLAAGVADRNPEAVEIGVIVTALKFPPPAEYLNGGEPSYRFICSYDFVPDEARERSGHEWLRSVIAYRILSFRGDRTIGSHGCESD